MKQFLLSVTLLCGIGSDCLTLDQKDAVAIAAGATVAVGLWSWWGHVSNKNAITRAECLWQDCHAFVGKQDNYLESDLQKSLYLLGVSPILKRQREIVDSYTSLSKKMNWFWNKSCRMKQAYENSKKLKRSLEAYEILFNTVKQQLAVQKVTALWNGFTQYDVNHDPGLDVVDASTLQRLLDHPAMLNRHHIVELYYELYNASAYCFEFEQAHTRIVALMRAYNRLHSVCEQIRTYDRLVEKYQDFMLYLYQPHHKQDFVAEARHNSSGEYPLLNFVTTITRDMNKLSEIKLKFSYIRLQNGSIISFDNALCLVVQHLKMVCLMVEQSSYYQDELRYYREKLRLQEEQRRLAEEQRRLKASLNKVQGEIDHLKYENGRLSRELTNQKNK